MLGLLTPFFATTHEMHALVTSARRLAADIFTEHSFARRFGTAMMLRLVERNGVAGLQVALFCPWETHD